MIQMSTNLNQFEVIAIADKAENASAEELQTAMKWIKDNPQFTYNGKGRIAYCAINNAILERRAKAS